MDAVSVKELINRYPFGALMVSFIVVLVSISQIIGLAKPSPSSFVVADKAYMASYPAVTAMAYKPDLSYQGFVGELSAKFPNQPDLATKFNVSPTIDKLPVNEQGNAIRLSVLESRIEYLQLELNRIVESQSESLIFKLAFYFWAFLVWMGSVVIGRILEHLTDHFNNKYLNGKAV